MKGYGFVQRIWIYRMRRIFIKGDEFIRTASDLYGRRLLYMRGSGFILTGIYLYEHKRIHTKCAGFIRTGKDLYERRRIYKKGNGFMRQSTDLYQAINELRGKAESLLKKRKATVKSHPHEKIIIDDEPEEVTA